MLAKLLTRTEIAKDTLSLSLEKPSGFTYQAGQFVDITLLNPPETDGEGNTRTFSIAAPPSNPHLWFATRMRPTAFKRVLQNLPLNTQLEVSEPLGSFILHNNPARPAAYLIGGIGITPVFSIIQGALDRGLPHQHLLFYSNRSPEDAPFLGELTKLARAHANFHFIPTMTNLPAQEKWPGDKGYISAAMINQHLPDLDSATFYLAGPAAMVKAMRGLLQNLKVDSDYIKTEEFSGYS